MWKTIYNVLYARGSRSGPLPDQLLQQCLRPPYVSVCALVGLIASGCPPPQKKNWVWQSTFTFLSYVNISTYMHGKNLFFLLYCRDWRTSSLQDKNSVSSLLPEASLWETSIFHLDLAADIFLVQLSLLAVQTAKKRKQIVEVTRKAACSTTNSCSSKPHLAQSVSPLTNQVMTQSQLSQFPY